MKKPFVVKMVSAVLVLLLVFLSMAVPDTGARIGSLVQVYGDTTSDLNNARDEAKDLNSQIENTKTEIANLKKQSSDTQAYINALDQKMVELDGELYTLNNQIEQKAAEITSAEENLAQAEADSVEQYEMMKLRIKFMYEHNQESYFAMLLSSGSMSELLNRAEYISKISAYDRQMLVRYQETVDYIAATKVQLETDYALLDQMKVSLEGQRKSLEIMQEEKQQEMKLLQTQLAQTEARQNSLYADLDAQENKIKAMEEQQRREEEEKNAQLDNSGNVKPSGGIFCWPTVSKRITSHYGDTEDRSSPHKGLDIGAVKPGVWGDEIFAAESGKVTIAGDGGTAGNWVWIYHGNGLYTVYMHCSKLMVTTGQNVTRGQTIALMGSTGNSSGAHLHFGVRLNGVYVNPGPYLGI